MDNVKEKFNEWIENVVLRMIRIDERDRSICLQPFDTTPVCYSKEPSQACDGNGPHKCGVDVHFWSEQEIENRKRYYENVHGQTLWVMDLIREKPELFFIPYLRGQDCILLRDVRIMYRSTPQGTVRLFPFWNPEELLSHINREDGRRVILEKTAINENDDPDDPLYHVIPDIVDMYSIEIVSRG